MSASASEQGVDGGHGSIIIVERLPRKGRGVLASINDRASLRFEADGEKICAGRSGLM